MKRFPAAVLLTLILVSSFLLKFNHLGHGAIKRLNESFHAVAAKNLIKHPLTPTLSELADALMIYAIPTGPTTR